MNESGLKKRQAKLGLYLKTKREQAKLSQGDVAARLGLLSSQSVSDWERGYGSSIPIRSLKKLTKLYKMPADRVFDLLVEYQILKLKAKLSAEFYGRKSDHSEPSRHPDFRKK